MHQRIARLEDIFQHLLVLALHRWTQPQQLSRACGELQRRLAQDIFQALGVHFKLLPRLGHAGRGFAHRQFALAQGFGVALETHPGIARQLELLRARGDAAAVHEPRHVAQGSPQPIKLRLHLTALYPHPLEPRGIAFQTLPRTAQPIQLALQGLTGFLQLQFLLAQRPIRVAQLRLERRAFQLERRLLSRLRLLHCSIALQAGLQILNLCSSRRAVTLVTLEFADRQMLTLRGVTRPGQRRLEMRSRDLTGRPELHFQILQAAGVAIHALDALAQLLQDARVEARQTLAQQRLDLRGFDLTPELRAA